MTKEMMVSTVASKKPKTLFTLDSPYKQVNWHAHHKSCSRIRTNPVPRPVMLPEDQTVILDMLCGLLSPIGDHRSQHVLPSKGKRKKKRKREHEYTDKDEDAVSSRRGVLRVALPTPPDIQRHVIVGFNATTRYLEDLAWQSNASRGSRRGSQEETAKDSNVVALDCPKTDTYMPLAAIFVPHSDQTAMLYAHIPLLAKLTSSSFATLPPTCLVVLTKGAEQKLGSALGIPRVGLIGLHRDAPESEALMDFVKQKVPEVEGSWVEDVAAGSYLPVKIREIETSAPIRQKRMGNVS